MSSTLAPTGPVDYQEVQQREQFQDLRRTHRSFVFPMTLFFLVFYLIYVTLGAFVPELFAIKVFGNITFGVLYGLSQFVVVGVITAAYVSFTNKKLDPKAVAIREELEAREARFAEQTAARQEEDA